jgi:pyrroloquinoline quinone biosynthesis protein E
MRPGRKGSLAVEVTGRCDRNCKYCYNWWRPGEPPPDLPADELVPLVERALAQSGLDGVQLTGGEPLLRPDLPQILERLHRPGRSLSLVTDGGLLDDEWVARLKRLGVGPVQPTLLAADRTRHDELKGARCFDATVEGIARLRRAKVPVTVSFVCTRANFAHFGQVAELCFALGVGAMAFSRFCHAGQGAHHAAELQPDPSQVKACLQVAEEAVVRLGLRVHVAISLPLCMVDPRAYPHLRFGRCAATSGNPGFTLDPQGRLRACSTSPTILGDLRVEPWAVVMERARRGYLADMACTPHGCRGCPMMDSCGGGCRESALGVFGDLEHPDPLAVPRG